MPAFIYEKEFNLTPHQAYDIIMLWLGAIHAAVKDHTEPTYIKAVHGSHLKILGNYGRKKTVIFNIEPSGLGIKIHLKTPLILWRRKKRLLNAKESWDEHLFSQLWVALSEPQHDKMLQELEVLQFLNILPEIKRESDLKRVWKKLCHAIKNGDLTITQVPNLVKAIKLHKLKMKIFKESKKEKVFKMLADISNKLLGETLTQGISDALSSFLD